MPRTTGSKNRKNKGVVRTLNFDKQVAGAPVCRETPNKWVSYGLKNDYPLQLIDLFNTSVTHRSCVEFAANAIVGDGIDWESLGVEDPRMYYPNEDMSWDEFIKAMSFNYVLFGAFGFQVIRSMDGSSYSFYPQPVETIRLEERDSEGKSNGAYLCKDWTAWNKYGVSYIRLFDGKTEIPRGEPFLFYWRKSNPVVDYYGLPAYTSAINAIQAEAQYQVYDLKSVVNGFCPMGSLTLPQVDTEEERAELIRQVQQLFSGAENANSLIITFRSNIEDSPIAFTPFTQNSEGVNLYESANDRTVNRIIAAHRIPSKGLIGLPIDDTGFSNSGEYLQTAYNLYNINVAKSNRGDIMNAINSMLELNGIDFQLTLKPLSYVTATSDTEEPRNIEQTPE